MPPSIASNSERVITVDEGDIASLPCESQGYPPPKISWIHDGRTMIHDDDRHQIQQSGTLTVANVQVRKGKLQPITGNFSIDQTFPIL